MGVETSHILHYLPPPPNIQQQLVQAQAEQQRLQASINELQNKINQNDHIESEVDLNNHKIVSIQHLHKLAQQVVPLDLSGCNVGLFGVTSAGKSSTVNALMGSKVAEVGIGETTKEITAYDGQNFRLYDFPGQNDDLSYFDKEYIALMKGLTHRLVLITATIKEAKKLLNLFEAIDLQYDIVVNKIDAIDFEERTAFRQLIDEEIKQCQLKNLINVWCISAKHPEQFPDWLNMVNRLTMS